MRWIVALGAGGSAQGLPARLSHHGHQGCRLPPAAAACCQLLLPQNAQSLRLAKLAATTPICLLCRSDRHPPSCPPSRLAALLPTCLPRCRALIAGLDDPARASALRAWDAINKTATQVGCVCGVFATGGGGCVAARMHVLPLNCSAGIPTAATHAPLQCPRTCLCPVQVAASFPGHVASLMSLRHFGNRLLWEQEGAIVPRPGQPLHSDSKDLELRCLWWRGLVPGMLTGTSFSDHPNGRTGRLIIPNDGTAGVLGDCFMFTDVAGMYHAQASAAAGAGGPAAPLPSVTDVATYKLRKCKPGGI